MNEILLALLAFALGILTTILTQTILRRWQLADARKRLKLDSVRSVRAWMEAYRTILKCNYPDMRELVFADLYLEAESFPLDPTASIRVYQALKEYRDARKELEEAEKSARDAVDSLNDTRTRILDWLSFRVRLPFTKQSAYAFLYAPGFPREIASYLEILSEQEYRIYSRFPDRYVRVDWDKFDFIEPAQVATIIHTRLSRWDHRNPSAQYREEQDAAVDARDNLSMHKRLAEQAIDGVLRVIRKYEKKWLVPGLGS